MVRTWDIIFMTFVIQYVHDKKEMCDRHNVHVCITDGM